CTDINALKKTGLIIIEDCCQCIGGCIDGKLAGTFGDVAVLSFNATKCLTTGEGGAILINNSTLVNAFKNLKGLQHILRMSDLQAALGLSQLSHFDLMLKKRKKIADIYFKLIHPDLTKHFAA